MSREKNQDSGVESSALVGRGRWSARRKVSVVLEVLRGEDLETLSRRNGVTAATISSWRDLFLAGGEAGLKSRETDASEEERQRMKSVVADLAMDNELLRAKIRQMEQNRPLAPWKSKP
jgi:transposase